MHSSFACFEYRSLQLFSSGLKGGGKRAEARRNVVTSRLFIVSRPLTNIAAGRKLDGCFYCVVQVGG